MPLLPKVTALRDGKFVEVAAEELDLVLPDNHSLMTTGTNLIPLQNAVASPRIFYGNRFWSQTDPLDDPDEPLVQNEWRKGVSFDRYLAPRAGARFARRAGEVLEADENHLRLRYEDGEEEDLPLYRNHSLNRKNAYHQEPLVRPGDRVAPDQPVVRSNFTNARGSIAMGRNARVALTPYLGYTIDDATVISESMARKLSSRHLLDYESETAEEGELTRRNDYQALNTKRFTAEQLDKLTEEGVPKPGTILQNGDPIMLRAVPRRVRAEDRNRGALSKYLRNSKLDRSQVWDYDEPGVVKDVVQRRDGGYHVLVDTIRPAKESDKIVARSGAKFTVSKIIPDEDMPQDEEGRPFDIMANPLGLNSRVNNSFLYEMLLSKIAEKRGEPLVVPGFNPDTERWNSRIREMLKEEGLKDTERVWDPQFQTHLEQPVSTGLVHFLKLQHQGEGKLSSRGQGAYDSWESPLKGGDEMAQAKRQSGLETAALVSAGAYGFIKDGITVRGQKNQDYWAAVKEGRQPPKVGHPFAWNRTEALLHGAGYRVSDLGNGVRRLGPVSDRDLETFRAEEIDNADIIDPKTGEPIPGGLFDNSRAERNAWGKISLDVPLPNPAFETPLRKLLNLKGKEYEEVLLGERSLRPDAEDPDRYKGPLGMYRYLKESDPAVLEKTAREEIRSGSKTKRPRAIDTLNTLRGLERNGLRPHDLMITAIPVIPARFRPYSFQGDTFIPGDVNELYRDVFRLREQNREIRDLLGDGGAGAHNLTLLKGMRALYGHDRTENRKLRDKEVSGFLSQVLGESPKYSVFQRRLFSKPVDSAGRAVAGLDPTLGLDEVGIPETMAWKLYAPYVQRRLVRTGTKPAEALREVREETPKARAALIQELKERPGTVTRAPSWWKWNALGAHFKMHDGNNVRVNPLIAKGLNLDYDGDQEIGYVFVCGPRALINTYVKKGLTKLEEYTLINGMFKNLDIPHYDKTNESVCLLDLADFPRGELMHSKEGEKGRIDFYGVPQGLKVISFDEATNRPVWADVAFWTVHPDREVEIVNLSNGYQIITDDDLRAVYGFDPSSDSLVPARFTPTEAKKRNILPLRLKDLQSRIPDEGVDAVVPFAGRTWTNDLGLAYFLGAMAGDGWCDKRGYGHKESRYWFYLADQKEYVATKLKDWLNTWIPDFKFHRKEQLKENDSTRYGDTVKHTFVSNTLGKQICEDLVAQIGGEATANSAGSGSKHAPNHVFGASAEYRRAFLAGILDTDGTISNPAPKAKKKSQLTASVGSNSLTLLRDVKFIASTLGIRGRISFSKKTTRGNDAWILVFSTVDFYQKGEGIVKYMVTPSKLDAFAEAEPPSLDCGPSNRMNLKPIPASLIEPLTKVIGAPKITKKMRETNDPRLPGINETLTIYSTLKNRTKTTGTISAPMAKRIIERVNASESPEALALKSTLLYQQWMVLVWNPEIVVETIESVEYTGKRETGYDLTVPGYETFANAEGIILSNTLGIFVPSLPEAVQDVRDKLMASKQIFSIRDPDDIVNLPQQDLLYGLYRAKARPAVQKHHFPTKADAIRAARQRRISWSDEVTWDEE